MEFDIPANQLVRVECTNKKCNSTTFYMVVADNTDPTQTNFKGSVCPYCKCRTIINSNGE